MSFFRQRFLAWITPGAAGVLWLLLVVYLAMLLGSVLHLYDLAGWLALTGPKLFAGQAWRLLTYAWLSPGLPFLIGNALSFIFLGILLERFWTRGDFWLYCAVTAMGAGLARVCLQPSGGMPLMGPGPVTFGLLLAVAFVRGREVVQSPPLTGMVTWHLVLVVGAIILASMALSTGLVPAMVTGAGALTGYLYLSLRYKWLMNRDSRVVQSDRISRLEL